MSGAIIIGAGRGIGVSVARRFAREGLPVGVVARTRPTVDKTLAALTGTNVETYGTTADAADELSLRATLDDLVEHLGVPDVVVYNAAVIQWDSIGDLTVDEHLHAWAVNVVGAITTAAHLLPRVAEAGGGTFIITGGMPTPVPDATSLSLGKAGVRALAEMLEAQFSAGGVHVATVTVAGAVASRTAFDPDAIADEYWRLHQQAPDEWDREVLFAGRPHSAQERGAQMKQKDQPREAPQAVERAAMQRTAADAERYQSDVEPFIALHTPDAIIVNIAGHRVLGAEAISQAMSQALATPLAKVLTRSEIDDIRFVRPDVAIVSSTKEVSDERAPSSEGGDGGSLPSTGRLTYVMVRDDGAWRIALAQTTPIAS